MSAIEIFRQLTLTVLQPQAPDLSRQPPVLNRTNSSEGWESQTLPPAAPVLYRVTSQIGSVDFSYRSAGALDRFRRHPG